MATGVKYQSSEASSQCRSITLGKVMSLVVAMWIIAHTDSREAEKPIIKVIGDPVQ
jgi:hypothetical protein